MKRLLLSTELLDTFPFSFFCCVCVVVFLTGFCLLLFDVFLVVTLASVLFLTLSLPALFLARAILLILCKLSGGGVSSSSSSTSSASSLSSCSKLATGCKLNPCLSSAGCRSNPRPSVKPDEVATAGVSSKPFAPAAGCRVKPAASSAGCKSKPRPSFCVALEGIKSIPRDSNLLKASLLSVSSTDDSTLESACNAPTGFKPNPLSPFSAETKELSFSCLVSMGALSFAALQSSVTITG